MTYAENVVFAQVAQIRGIWGVLGMLDVTLTENLCKLIMKNDIKNKVNWGADGNTQP